MSTSPPVVHPVKLPRFALGVVKEHTPRSVRRAVMGQVLSAAQSRLQGDAVSCPACDHAAGGFFRGRYCVSCGSGQRQRLIALFLRRELAIEQSDGLRILHFAPEIGLVRMLSKLPGVDYYPGDLVPDRGHHRVDATDIKLAPGFDGIIISHVLEHIPDDGRAIHELYRVLAPGGWAVVLVPVYPNLDATWEDPGLKGRWEREKYYGQHDHVRLYGMDFSDRLKAAGFDVTPRSYASELSPDNRARFGVDVPEVIYLCRRSGAA